MIRLFHIFISFLFIFLPFSVNARCAICYTQGLSGASIAIIVIVLSAIFLFIANKFLRKLLNKYI